MRVGDRIRGCGAALARRAAIGVVLCFQSRGIGVVLCLHPGGRGGGGSSSSLATHRSAIGNLSGSTESRIARKTLPSTKSSGTLVTLSMSR